MMLTEENWVRDGARAVDDNNTIVIPYSPKATKWSVLGFIQSQEGIGRLVKGGYYRSLLSNSIHPDTSDSKLTLDQANSILETYYEQTQTTSRY